MHSRFQEALRQTSTPSQTHEEEEKFERLADRPVSEERPATRTQHTPSASSARIEKSMRDQIAGIQTLVEDGLMRLLGNGVRSIESNSNPAVIRKIQTVGDRSDAKALQGPTFNGSLKQALQNLVL